jgi:hypothetical protein
MTQWKNYVYEMSTRRCTWITNEMCWVRSELHDLLWFDVTIPLDAFIVQMENNVPETQRIQAMDAVM